MRERKQHRRHQAGRQATSQGHQRHNNSTTYSALSWHRNACSAVDVPLLLGFVALDLRMGQKCDVHICDLLKPARMRPFLDDSVSLTLDGRHDCRPFDKPL